MRYISAFCMLLLTSEPLITYANKVVLVIPQQTRRMYHGGGGGLGPSWQPPVPRFRKSSLGNEVHYHKYHHGPYFPKKSVYRSPPFPHGGDDFDQGYEHVNHVRVPYGKDISHAISFGKGYIPYDKIKGSFSFGRERKPSLQEQSYQPEPEFSSTQYTSPDSDYSPSGQSYESSHPETFFPDPETALNYNERRNDRKKFYTSRSIEKDIIGNNPLTFASDKDSQILLVQQKGVDLYKSVPAQPQDGVLLPSGVPSATIGGSKEGIVLRDTVALDEYQQKLQEMTKSWPQFLSNPATAFANNYQSQHVAASYSTDGSSVAAGFGGSIDWPTSFAQPKQGYDVKEDTMEQPQNFRMPVHASPYNTVSVPVSVAIPTIAQPVHG